MYLELNIYEKGLTRHVQINPYFGSKNQNISFYNKTAPKG